MLDLAYGDTRVQSNRRAVAEACYGILLFTATAAFVLRQSAHAVSIWDLSHILEHADRIALGQHAYRDFPLPYAPVTFLIQAAIIRLFGRVVIHHYIYAAVTAAAATLLTWRIIRRILSGTGLRTRLLAMELTLPLVFLSTGGSLPIPWYDSDCTLIILLFVWLLLRLEQAEFPVFPTFVAGTLPALSVFVKQNTGGAFLLSFMLCLLLYVLLTHRWKALMFAAGAFFGLAVALVTIHVECGLHNYFHWTMTFASSRRMPGARLLLRPYFVRAADVMYLVALGAAVWQWRQRRMDERLVAGALALPFVWAVVGCLRYHTVLTRFKNLELIWPFILLVSLTVTVLRLPKARGFEDLLPIALFGMLNGAFLSQSFWGSTFAVWPFLFILIALLLRAMRSMERMGPDSSRLAVSNQRALEGFSAFVCVAMVGLGAFYTLTFARLSYVRLSGAPERSSLPALRGLTAPGRYLPQLDELVGYTNRTIPQGDAILVMPGEDPFYYATGRTPQFPVSIFDRTVNPYSSEELVKIARERHVRWLIIQREYQFRIPRVSPYSAKVPALLAPDLELAARLENYTVYRVKEESADPRVSAKETAHVKAQ